MRQIESLDFQTLAKRQSRRRMVMMVLMMMSIMLDLARRTHLGHVACIFHILAFARRISSCLGGLIMLVSDICYRLSSSGAVHGRQPREERGWRDLTGAMTRPPDHSSKLANMDGNPSPQHHSLRLHQSRRNGCHRHGLSAKGKGTPADRSIPM